MLTGKIILRKAEMMGLGSEPERSKVAIVMMFMTVINMISI